MKTKIIFLHNKATWYRIPFFNGISAYFDVFFLFTNENNVTEFHPEYQIVKRLGKYPISFAFKAYLLVFRREYDIIILPPADSFGELIDVLILCSLAKIRRKKIIVWSERWRSPCTKRKFFSKIYDFFDSTCMKFVFSLATICAISGGIKQKEYFIKLGVRESKISTVPYVTDFIDEMNPEIEGNDIKNLLSINGKKIILYVGRLVKRKGVDYLIKTFSELRKKKEDICLLIIGGQGFYGHHDPNSFTISELEKYAQRLGLIINNDIFFLGDIPHKDLPPYYQICNIFVLPAISDIDVEPWGLVINEAMIFGKPVIATSAVGSAHTLLKDGENGFIIPEKNIAVLEEKLTFLLDHPDITAKMGERAKDFIDRNYKYPNMIDAFKKMVNTINEMENK
jgi:glycosyltransferase involved in cell wall biosynthesis